MPMFFYVESQALRCIVCFKSVVYKHFTLILLCFLGSHFWKILLFQGIEAYNALYSIYVNISITKVFQLTSDIILCGCILYSPRWTALPCVLLIMEPVTLAPSRITSSRLWVFVGCVLIHVLSAVTMVTCYFTSMM